MADQLKKIVAPSGGDYTSLESCMNANEQNLVTADKYFDVEISGTWTDPDTTGVTVHNYNTDSSRFVNIYVVSASRHDGRASSVSGRNNYRLYQVGFGSSIPYLTVAGIEIYNVNTGSNVSSAAYASYGAYHNVVFDGFLVHDCQGRCSGINFGAPYSDCCVRNCIVYNTHDDYSGGIRASEGGGACCYNNTVYNCGNATGQTSYGYGIFAFDYLKNNIAIGNGESSPLDFRSYTGGSNKDFNISLDSSAAGTNSFIGISPADLFVCITPGAEDLHLKSGSPAIDKGVDLSVVFTTDIDGIVRTGTWDIGADEYQIVKLYSRTTRFGLPANDSDLDTAFTDQDYLDVALYDASEVTQQTIDGIAIFLLKDQADTADNRISITWRGQSDNSTVTYPAYLDVYNRISTTWENVDSESGTEANTDFILSYVLYGLANYKDANGVISCRVRQALPISSSSSSSRSSSSSSSSPVCWVAAEVFGGWYEPDTIRARAYIINIAPTWFREGYIKYGERVAAWVHSHAWSKILLLPIFKRFSMIGKRWMEEHGNSES